MMDSALEFLVIGKNPIGANWDGAALVLQPSQSVNMPDTPKGSMILAYQNIASSPNLGTLAVVSGSELPVFLTLPAFAALPGITINNWKASNLNITNISPPDEKTPIRVETFYPRGVRQDGVRQDCVVLSDGDPTVPLAPGQCALGMTKPVWMQVIMQSSTKNLTLFALIGGAFDKAGNNAYVMAVNAAQNTGPGTNSSPPDGYYATTTGSFYTFEFNWGSSSLFAANMSTDANATALVSLRNL